ncbi:MAG: MFS transporter [Phycisphaerae bacterium]|nr:MFS transporter [Phycisphaerae bacterium]
MWLRLIAFVAFVSLGLPDGLLGVAWPSMREATGVPLAALGQLLAAGTAGYLISSVASGAVVSRIGVGRLLAGSTLLVVIALATLAASRAWPMILVAGVLSGLGAGAIDAGVNLFAAKAMSARAMLFLHASYGVGATLGPMIMTAAVARGGAGVGDAGGLGYGWGYGAVAGLMVPLIVVFAVTARAWDGGRQPQARAAEGSEVRRCVRARDLGACSLGWRRSCCTRGLR